MCLKYNYVDSWITCNHILIAGTSGSGKSVALDNFMLSAPLCVSSAFILIDPKMVSLDEYRIPQLCYDYAETIPEIISSLDYALDIMYNRFREMKANHQKTYEGAHLWICIDELADIMGNREIAQKLITIGRLGRAALVHIVACTQSPNRRTLPAELVQNFDLRCGLRCLDPIESRQIIGRTGCENLPRYGEAIVRAPWGYEHMAMPMYPENERQRTLAALRAV